MLIHCTIAGISYWQRLGPGLGETKDPKFGRGQVEEMCVSASVL